jgi:NADP-dependent 3-hydroxy acid dehydrogenase YdfG
MAWSGQTAVITGASSGIGAAIARELNSGGAELHLVGRSRERLQAAVEEGARVRFYEADLSNGAETRHLGEKLAIGLERVDLLVHCAGMIALGAMDRACVEALDAQYQVNLRAPFVLTQALLPATRSARGQVIFVNSSAGLRANAQASQYSATKHGLKALADSLREEVNRDGVRVLSVYPGRTNTPMQRALVEWEGKEWHPEMLLQPEDVARVVLASAAMPRTAEIVDVMLRPMQKC